MENKNNNLIKLIIVCLFIILLIIILVFFQNNNYKKDNETIIDIDSTVTKLEVEYNESTTIDEYTGKINLNNNKIEISGSGIINSNNTITITKGGSYYITGENEDCNIVIDAEKQEVQLFLENCNINSKTTAPINGINASSLIITLVENSENVISDSNEYSKFTDIENSEPDGTIFTKTDLVINGTGNLKINANYKDGIVSKDTLKISNCNIDINSADDGIRGKDFTAINNANITINSDGDGIKATNSEDVSLGYILIEGGNININSKADGIQAETILNISNESNINIVTSGKITSSNQMDYRNLGGSYSSTITDDGSSSKALKSGSEISILSGNINITSTDDSIHSNGKIIIENVNLNISSGDDGIHADTNIIINSGKINISKSYEGIESSYIEINDGDISVVASDDGINVAGGNDNSSMMERPGQNNFSNVSDSNKKLLINGGSLFINATGDGLDSNGSIEIISGNIEVAGPTSGGNGALDYGSSCTINGGNIIIYGSTGMWQNASNSSTQYCLTYVVSGNSGDEIILKDESGNEIANFKTQKSYGAILFSNEKIENGKKYILYKNGENVGELEVTNIINSMASGGMNSGNMNQGMPNEKNFKGGRRDF